MSICLSIVLVEVKSSYETSVGGKRYAVNSSMVYLNDPSLSCHTRRPTRKVCCREGWLLRTSRDVSSENASIVSKVTTPSMLRLTPRRQFLAVFKARAFQSPPNRFSTRNKNLQTNAHKQILCGCDISSSHLPLHTNNRIGSD